MTSHLKGPSEGEWSVFASKVVEERDTLLAEVERLRADRAADLKTMDSMATDAHEYEQKRNQEADALRAEVERLRASRDEWREKHEQLDRAQEEEDEAVGRFNDFHQRTVKQLTSDRDAQKARADEWVRLAEAERKDCLERIAAMAEQRSRIEALEGALRNVISAGAGSRICEPCVREARALLHAPAAQAKEGTEKT